MDRSKDKPAEKPAVKKPKNSGWKPTVNVQKGPKAPNALPGFDVNLGKVISSDPATGKDTATLSDGTQTSDTTLLGPTPKKEGGKS
jgi:hypothetical protein